MAAAAVAGPLDDLPGGRVVPICVAEAAIDVDREIWVFFLEHLGLLELSAQRAGPVRGCDCNAQARARVQGVGVGRGQMDRGWRVGERAHGSTAAGREGGAGEEEGGRRDALIACQPKMANEYFPIASRLSVLSNAVALAPNHAAGNFAQS